MRTEARHLTPERILRNEAGSERSVGDPLMPGRQIAGHYRLERQLGPGGRVWRASDRSGGPVALKAGPAMLVEHEYRLLSSVSHPHVVRALDMVYVEDSCVLVLEYLAGGDLVSLTGDPPARWLNAAAGIAAALASLHAAGVVHRDLKSRNVMFDNTGSVRLIDFGSAAAAGSSWTTAGTTTGVVDPHRGSAPVNATDDVRAFAALLHELIHGAPPGFGSRSANGCPADLVELVVSCLSGKDGLYPELSCFSAVIESLLGNPRSLQA